MVFFQCFCFFFQFAQVSSNVPYDKLGGNSNVTLTHAEIWKIPTPSFWHFSAATLATQAMSLRHAAAYGVFDKEEDIVKAARNLSGASVMSLQIRIVNHAQNTR